MVQLREQTGNSRSKPGNTACSPQLPDQETQNWGFGRSCPLVDVHFTPTKALDLIPTLHKPGVMGLPVVPALRNQDGHKFKVSLYLACLEYVRPCPCPLQKTKQKDVTKQGEQGGALEDAGLFSAPLGTVLIRWLRIWMQEPKAGINKRQQKQTKQSKQMKNANPPGTPALETQGPLARGSVLVHKLPPVWQVLPLQSLFNVFPSLTAGLHPARGRPGEEGSYGKPPSGRQWGQLSDLPFPS